MMYPRLLSLAWCAGVVTAAGLVDALPESQIMYGSDGMFVQPRKIEERGMGGIASCTNSPTSRNCWSTGYTVADDFDKKWPTTGVTRYYTLTLTNTTCNPDGSSPGRYCSLINGQFPGPVISADWGDNLEITVINNLQYNGTSIHWHGVRQEGTYSQDGVNGITQCPLAPGQTQVFKFQATQFGTSWYHSHHSAQFGDGVQGPIVFNGPTAANYDIDLGPLVVSDWYYQSMFAIIDESLATTQQHQAPPTANNILINGTNMNPSGTTGKFLDITLVPGKKHLLRLINTATDNSIRVSIDGHTMQVVTADFVPVVPIEVESVLLSNGQRYEVIVTANQAAGNYWLRAEPEAACVSYNNGVGKAIVTYQGTTPATPSTSSSYTDGGSCTEPSPLTPWVQNQVGDESEFISQASGLGVSFAQSQLSTNNQSIVVWGLNFSAIRVNWEQPILSYLKNQAAIPQSESMVQIVSHDQWVFWIVQEVDPAFSMPHPMHLHGHDFYILGSGQGQFDKENDPAKLTYFNPTRRDTTILGTGGWTVLAFATDNPGAWLFHCHIAAHISEGLGVQFLESANRLKAPGAAYTNQCNVWAQYEKSAPYKQELSGL